MLIVIVMPPGLMPSDDTLRFSRAPKEVKTIG